MNDRDREEKLLAYQNMLKTGQIDETTYNNMVERNIGVDFAKSYKPRKNKNVEMFILSITRMTIGREEKNRWLDKYVEFIKVENRFIISREEHNFMPSKALKKKFIKNIKRDESIIIVIDDDPAIIDEIRKSSEDVYLLKDTSLVK